MRIAVLDPALVPIVALVLAVIAIPAPLLANEAPPAPANWRETKCAMYTDIRAEVLKSIPREDIGADFIKAEEDYISGGCRGRAYACPKTETQLQYANAVSLRVMSGGLSGTFLPYGCPGGPKTPAPQ
ncbi:hypothetical protein AUP42_02305 [Thalassospira lucentensis]|uniref:Uncharacterized protein n=1 Tax=Thalassospira lucentensis TaxID=168935 RepID=A0A154L2Z6_9PROT|nr:hypothetical protein [Thalassospira lucentensis]KZB62905.1 hypothetical protein AUP42_02305 [Thalassospira lucentensis]